LDIVGEVYIPIDRFILRHLKYIKVFPTTMGKKDKKSKTAEQKTRVAAKQIKKAAQKDKKSKSKGPEDSDAEDVDLESVLEEYAKKVNGYSCYDYDYDTRVQTRIRGRNHCEVSVTALDSKLTLHCTASPVSQSYRDTLRATVAAFLGYSNWLTLQQQRAVSFWRRVLQWSSCHVLQ
jgi:hypothetical protein